MEKIFAYHVEQPGKNLTTFTDSVEKYLKPMGVNMVILEMNYQLSFKTFPELSGNTISYDELRTSCDRFRAMGIEPVPLFNCLGHQGWGEPVGLVKAYPEFSEVPDIPNEYYHHVKPYYTPQWCAAEPRVFDYVLPCIDEYIEVTGCKYFHIGMDEVFLFGFCDRCKDKDPAELYYNNVMVLYNHLKEKGVQTMIWGDRFLSATKLLGEAGKGRDYDFENIGISKIIDRLPKDIIMCDWHYGTEERYPSMGEFLKHGFTTLPCTWYTPEAAKAFWEDSLRQADELNARDLIPGMVVTGWIMPTDFTVCFEGNPQVDKKEYLQLGETFKVTEAMMNAYEYPPKK